MRHPLAGMSAALVVLACVHCGGSGGSSQGGGGTGQDGGGTAPVDEGTGAGGGYSAPSGAAAAPRSGDSVAITWIDQSTGESGFRIERSTPAAPAFTEVGTAPADAASFDDVRLAPGTAYSYRVRAYGPAGESPYSNVADAETPATPAAPAAAPVLSVGGTSAVAATVGWTASAGAQGYRLERQRYYLSETGWVYTPWTLIRSFDAQIYTAGGSFTDRFVSPSTTYQYRIVAYNLGGETSWSNTVSATTRAPTGPPADAVSDLTVQRPSSTSALFTWSIAASSQIEDLRITLTGSNGWSATLAMLGDGTSLTLQDLQPGVTYALAISPHNRYGGGDGSTATAVTAQVAGPAVVPSPPQLFHGYPVADNRRVLSDLLVSQNDAVLSTGELDVGCNWFWNSFQVIQNTICYSSAVRFDVSALAGKTVTQAQLWLKPFYPAPSPDTYYSVSAIATSWSAGTLTGLTELETYTAGQWMVPAPTSFAPIGFDVTQIVQSWASGAWPNHGFLLQDMSYVFPYNTIFRASSFYSSDYYFSGVDDPPQLWVEYH